MKKIISILFCIIFLLPSFILVGKNESKLSYEKISRAVENKKSTFEAEESFKAGKKIFHALFKKLKTSIKFCPHFTLNFSAAFERAIAAYCLLIFLLPPFAFFEMLDDTKTSVMATVVWAGIAAALFIFVHLVALAVVLCAVLNLLSVIIAYQNY